MNLNVKSLCFVSVICAGLLTQGANAKPLADRHAARGIKCENCHLTMPPQKNVKETACIACHGNYEKLAKQTEDLDVNPHESHQGEVPCGRCHSGHQKSVLFCNGCHEFPLSVP